ncbi:proton-coupled folate transporter-like isoform X1 [Tigriopus californicus]|nr:proton-coupled folate transporter-like isoform X1 [Tigriopus californicus]
MFAAEQGSNLMMNKICELELGYNQTTCLKRGTDFSDVEVDVQRYTNMFELRRKYIAMVPQILYTLVAGALSDSFGRKPLLFFPMLGRILGKTVHLLHLMFYHELPIWAYYFTELSDIMGGIPIYYMGVYGYGSNTVDQAKRAARLARFDGVEQVAYLTGAALSPVVFRAFGCWGSFLSGITINIAALLILVLRTPEPIVPKEEKSIFKDANSSDTTFSKITRLFHRCVTQPLSETKATLAKKRDHGLRTVLYLAFFNYAIYLLVLNINSLEYLYLKLVFPGFTGEDMAVYKVLTKTFVLITMFILMPYFNGKLHWHETSILSIISTSLVWSYFGRGIAANLIPQYYAAGLLGFLQLGLYCTNRSLITRCIDDGEIGKAFAGVSILTAMVMAVSQPIYRHLYDATLDVFPGSIFMVTASALAVASLVNYFLVSKRRSIQVGRVTPTDSTE